MKKVLNLNLKVSTKSKGFMMGWKRDYFQKVSVSENLSKVKKSPKTFNSWESTIYLAIWTFSDLKKTKC